jgi:hypothetical protein
MGHNTPAPVIPAQEGAYAGKEATTGDVSLTNNSFEQWSCKHCSY